jgi:hypothetical protein
MPLRFGDKASVTDVDHQPGSGKRLECRDHLRCGGVYDLSDATPWSIPEYLRLRWCLEPPMDAEKVPGSLECQQRPRQPAHGYCLFQGRHAASLRSSYLRLLWCPLRAEPRSSDACCCHDEEGDCDGRHMRLQKSTS